MALINIEYGSIASSETLNTNFSYLDGRISDSNTQINTSISSILSNISTINSSLSTLSETLSSAVTTLESTIADYKTKTKALVKKSGMVPNWSACRSINFTSGQSYTVTSNGYVLVLPTSSNKGNIKVNGVTIQAKHWDNAYDYSCELITIPVKSGDVLTTTIGMKYAYMLPVAEITVANF